MKKIMIMVAAMVVGSSVMAQDGLLVRTVAARPGSMVSYPVSMVVTTVSTMILPSRTTKDANDFVLGSTNTQGQLVKENESFYWAAIAGISSNAVAPSGLSDTVSLTTTWRKVPTGSRNGFSISNLGAIPLDLSFGITAVSGKGYRLAAGASLVISAGAPQCSIHAISTNVVSVGLLDW